jgi:hypothetical protein
VVAASPPACPVHVVGKRIEDAAGRTTYRYPGNFVPRAEIRCSGRVVWVLLHGGGASSQELYLGLRSSDRGRTWRLLLAEPYFGIKAPFMIDSYSGPWTIVGQNAAYFVGWCPVCIPYGTVSLTVTLDGGRHFHRYQVPLLNDFRATSVTVAGDDVAITAESMLRVGPRTRTAVVDVR